MSLAPNFQNSLRALNQAQTTKVSNPPAVNSPDPILRSAGGNNLLNTKVDQTGLLRSVNMCQRYKGINGLRQLQIDQSTNSALQPGCGWRYKPSSGVNPEINQAAFGTADGPSRTDLDPMPGGTKWFWNLATAEKTITKAICSNASKCSQLRNLGEYASVCGYCKTSGGVVPVQQLKSGQFTARYPTDPDLMCDASSLIINGRGVCPANEGFTNLNMDILDNCSSPLSRDCVINAARLAGCREDGTLLTSLAAATGPGDYNRTVKNKPSYQAYQSSANPGLTSSLLQDGSTSLDIAISDFGNLMRNTGGVPTSKLAASARDLCLKAGDFDNYNFCAEMTPNTVITSQNIQCIQQDWLDEGGTQTGRGYPTLAKWNGKRNQEYNTYITGVLSRLKSIDKNTNVAAILEFIGTDSTSKDTLTNNVPRNDNTRGGEVVWIQLGDVNSGTAPPTILRSDLLLSRNGGIIPTFNSDGELASKYGVPTTNIGFISAFEMRPDSDMDINLNIAVDDGFMVGFNQNPLEGTKAQGSDWGSWRYQGPTAYGSRAYPISAENKKGRNVFVTKFFQGYGGAMFTFKWGVAKQGLQDQATSAAARSSFYLTQEPLAPWLNYEVCTRLNDGRNGAGLFERRWGGQAAVSTGGKPIPSFDVLAKSLTVQDGKDKRADTPGKRAYISFTSKSSWKTFARIGFNSVQTITLLIRPTASITQGNWVNVLNWLNPQNQQGLLLMYTRQGNNYTMYAYTSGSWWNIVPVTPNAWNYVVIQVIGDRNGVRSMNVTSSPVKDLATPAQRSNLLRLLQGKRNATSGYQIQSAAVNANASSYLRMGGVFNVDNPDIPRWNESFGFEGDVAFLHGFRTYLDTEGMIDADVKAGWMSRWPRGDA